MKGHGCWVCGQAQASEQRRLSEQEWERRAAEAGVRWLEPAAANPKPLAECMECGYTWRVWRSNVTVRGSGCPVCAVPGLNPTAPSRVYLVALDGAIVKVGVMNEGTPRIQQHEAQGRSLIGSWPCTTGADAVTIERAVLRWWRDELGLAPALNEGDGWTETVQIGVVSVQQIVKFIGDRVGELTFPRACSYRFGRWMSACENRIPPLDGSSPRFLVFVHMGDARDKRAEERDQEAARRDVAAAARDMLVAEEDLSEREQDARRDAAADRMAAFQDRLAAADDRTAAADARTAAKRSGD